MNKTEINLKIPLGYRIIEKTKEVDLYTACDILRSRKQKHITTARRVGDKAILTSHRVVCPHCGREAPAYSWCYKIFSVCFPKKSELELLVWANIQPSLMDEVEDELKIQEFKELSDIHVCSKCGRNSYKSNDFMQLSVKCVDRKIYVKREIKNLSELLSLDWVTTVVAVEFPLHEQIVFDFESGITYLELISKEETICTTNVTDREMDFCNDVFDDLLLENKIIKRILKRLFEDVSGNQIPYSVNELDFSKFVNILRFNGFTKDFYESIPFRNGTSIIEGSFIEIARKLQNPEMAMKLLEKSSIPYCKSVKRLFAGKNGLFFYLRECEFLYSILGDVNLFRKLLSGEAIFYCLARLHNEIVMRSFLTEYSKVVGKIKTVKAILNNCRQVFEYGIRYCGLSDYAKSAMKEMWDKNSNLFVDFYRYDEFYEMLSVPMSQPPQNVKECVIGKYSFKILKTKKDYVVAGEKLGNCLSRWSAYDNPVVTVLVGRKMVAAIEIADGMVFQVKRKYNESINLDSELYNVICKWCGKCNIAIDPEKIDGPFIR